jgi:hypothetical protein
MDNAKRARRAPQHRRSTGRHREPARTVGDLTVAPATTGAKIAAVGVIGTASALAAPAAAFAQTGGGPSSTPTVNLAPSPVGVSYRTCVFYCVQAGYTYTPDGGLALQLGTGVGTPQSGPIVNYQPFSSAIGVEGGIQVPGFSAGVGLNTSSGLTANAKTPVGSANYSETNGLTTNYGLFPTGLTQLGTNPAIGGQGMLMGSLNMRDVGNWLSNVLGLTPQNNQPIQNPDGSISYPPGYVPPPAHLNDWSGAFGPSELNQSQPGSGQPGGQQSGGQVGPGQLNNGGAQGGGAPQGGQPGNNNGTPQGGAPQGSAPQSGQPDNSGQPAGNGAPQGGAAQPGGAQPGTSGQQGDGSPQDGVQGGTQTGAATDGTPPSGAAANGQPSGSAAPAASTTDAASAAAASAAAGAAASAATDPAASAAAGAAAAATDPAASAAAGAAAAAASFGQTAAITNPTIDPGNGQTFSSTSLGTNTDPLFGTGAPQTSVSGATAATALAGPQVATPIAFPSVGTTPTSGGGFGGFSGGGFGGGS